MQVKLQTVTDLTYRWTDRHGPLIRRYFCSLRLMHDKTEAERGFISRLCNCWVLARDVIWVLDATGPILIYRVIKKCLCTWWLQYRKLQVMFKVPSASLQAFIDTANCVLEDCFQYSTVYIPKVFCLKYCILACFLYCNHKVHRDLLITL
jgi:hypothetical protein